MIEFPISEQALKGKSCCICGNSLALGLYYFSFGGSIIAEECGDEEAFRARDVYMYAGWHGKDSTHDSNIDIVRLDGTPSVEMSFCSQKCMRDLFESIISGSARLADGLT